MSAGAAPRLQLQGGTEQWPLRVPFRITGQTTVSLDIIVVTLTRSGISGRGEGMDVVRSNIRHRSPDFLGVHPRSIGGCRIGSKRP